MPGTIVGILLAAGRGSRFGSDKRLHRLLDGRPMALAAAQNLRPVCERLIAVLSPGSDTLAELLSAAGCEVLVCREADLGMGHSLAAGVAASADAAGWLVALADMPFIAPASHQAVAAALRQGAAIVTPECNGRRGHPVGFAGQWREQLLALTGDQGGRAILQANPDLIVTCALDDPGVLRDIDRPEDLASPPLA
jgi:molybdenum cofactor cytidylyltransferase